MCEGVEPALPWPLAHVLPPGIVSLDIVTAESWQERTADAVARLLEAMRSGSAVLKDLKKVRVKPEGWLLVKKGAARAREPEKEWDTEVEDMAAAVGVTLCINSETLPPLMQRLYHFAPRLMVLGLECVNGGVGGMCGVGCGQMVTETLNYNGRVKYTH